MKKAVQWAQEHGWSVEKLKSGHLAFRKEGCRTVFSSSTPSCPRVSMNTIKQLNRAESLANDPKPVQT